MQYSITHLTGVMAITGLFGGTLNYYLSLSEGKSHSLTNWCNSALLGVASSFLIPLFLNTISSTLVSSLLNGEGDIGDILVFSGFCLLAAISSRKFITTLSENVLKEASEAKEQAREASEAVNSTIVEPEAEKVHDKVNTEQVTSLSEDEKVVLKAMRDSRYQLRSASGLAKEIGKSKENTYTIFTSLSLKGYIAKITRKHGDRWALTKLGQVTKITKITDNMETTK